MGIDVQAPPALLAATDAAQSTWVRWTRGGVWERAPQYLFEVGGLAVVYYLAAKLGFRLGFTGPIAAIVWLPAGVAVSFLTLRGLRFWPGAVLGDLLSNNYSTVHIGGGLGQTAGNLMEVVLAAYLLRRLMRRGSPLDSTPSVVSLVIIAAVSTGASALIGPMSLFASGRLAFSALPTVMRTWWLGDACGVLIVVPLALAWLGPAPGRRERLRSRNAVGVVVVTGALVWASMLSEDRVAYIVFPALLYAAVRCGSRTASATVAVTASAAVWATTHTVGPFIFDSISHSVFSTQLFIVLSATSTALVAALVTEREQAIQRAEESRTEALQAEYFERQRLERDLHDGLQQRLLGLMLKVRQARVTREPGQLEHVLTQTGEGLVEAMHELRAIAQGTYPPMLTERGLAGAVEEMAIRSPIAVVAHELPTDRFDIATETIAYFVIAEAVTNAQKHAGASTIEVRVDATDQVLAVVVTDDGVGGAVTKEGSGIAGLRRRIEIAEGTLQIDSRLGHGTTVVAVIPFAQ